MKNTLPDYQPEVIEKLLRMGPPPRIFDDAFTARVLKRLETKGLVRPQTQSTSKKTTQDLSKYCVLAVIFKKQQPKFKPPFSFHAFKINQKKIESELLGEKLLQLEGGSFSVSAKGRRFMTDFESTQKSTQ